MIITIDTAKDSHEDVRKLIKFLQHHVGEPNVYNNDLETKDIPTPSAGIFDMFGDDSQSSQNVDSLLNDDNDEQEEIDEDFEIMSY